MPRSQREWIKALEQDGWTRERGGKHVVKMTKPGRRPITLPNHGGETCSKGLDAANPQTGGAMIDRSSDMEQRELHVDVHREEGAYWAEVRELPGCFASGATVAELIEAVEEAVAKSSRMLWCSAASSA